MEKPVCQVVEVWLQLNSQPIIHNNVQTYQKGLMYHVFEVPENRVFQYPIDHIWRVQLDYPASMQAHLDDKPINHCVKLWLDLSGEPILHENSQVYQKGLMYHVFEVNENTVFQYPIGHIWRVEVDYPKEMQAHPND